MAMDGRVDANARHQGSPLPSASGGTDVGVRSLTEPILTTSAVRVIRETLAVHARAEAISKTTLRQARTPFRTPDANQPNRHTPGIVGQPPACDGAN